MENKLFIRDLVILIQEKYNNSFFIENKSEKDKVFKLGLNFAYYDVLDLIESQLKAFQYDSDFIGHITPKLGEYCEPVGGSNMANKENQNK